MLHITDVKTKIKKRYDDKFVFELKNNCMIIKEFTLLADRVRYAADTVKYAARNTSKSHQNATP